MKILGVLPESIGGRLTTSSILDGFSLLGHKVVVYDELRDNYPLQNNYDLIVGYDFSALKLKRDYNLSMKSINYFSDVIRSRTSGPYWQELLPMLEDDDNYTFYWDRDLIRQENFKNIFYLPHFVNTNIYYDYSTKPQYDVMFAGRLDTDYRLNTIVDLVESLDINFAWYAIERHYNDALLRTKNKKIIEKIYKGFIDNEKDMADAINNTKIVINMNSQGVSSLNYRTIQTVACATLLISDNRGELDLFNNLIPTYNNFDELKNLVRYYLSNPTKTTQIANACQAICRDKCDSKSGVQFMLDKVL